MNTLLSLAHSFGPWIALCAVLLWYIFWLSKNAVQRGQRRERHLVERIESLESLYRDDLRDLLQTASTALGENTRALHSTADALSQIATALHHCPAVQPHLLDPLHHAAARVTRQHHA